MSSKILSVVENTESVDLFSYAAMSREEEVSARADAALVKAHIRGAADNMIQAGKALSRQKSKMPHGTFMGWVKDECEISDSLAKRLMKVAGDVGANSHLGGYLDEGLTSVRALEIIHSKGTPEAVKVEALELLADGETITVAKIREMKAAAKAAEDKIAGLETEKANPEAINAGGKKLSKADIEKVISEKAAAVQTISTLEIERAALLKKIEEAKAASEIPPEPPIDIEEMVAAALADKASELETKYLVEINKLKAQVAEKISPSPEDFVAMRDKATKEAESLVSAKIFELDSARTAADERAKALEIENKALVAASEEQKKNNVIRPEFGKRNDDDEREEDTDPTNMTEDECINAFSFNLGVMFRLKFSPSSFWKIVGKTKGHKKDTYASLVHVMEIMSKLNKEYQK